MEQFNNLLQTTINSPKPNYTPAEEPLINNLKANLTDNFNTAVESGLEPANIFKMVSIMSLISQKGITFEDLQNHNNLFVQLCMDSNFSIMDHNINNIVHQINRAKNS